MALFIKTNPKVAEHLGLTEVRNRMPDGNYMLWQADMLAFAPIPLILDTCKQIGALALQPHEARQEQDGEVCRPLPEALDERFRIEQTDGSDLPDESETEDPTNEQIDPTSGECFRIELTEGEAENHAAETDEQTTEPEGEEGGESEI